MAAGRPSSPSTCDCASAPASQSPPSALPLCPPEKPTSLSRPVADTPFLGLSCSLLCNATATHPTPYSYVPASAGTRLAAGTARHGAAQRLRPRALCHPRGPAFTPGDARAVPVSGSLSPFVRGRLLISAWYWAKRKAFPFERPPAAAHFSFSLNAGKEVKRHVKESVAGCNADWATCGGAGRESAFSKTADTHGPPGTPQGLSDRQGLLNLSRTGLFGSFPYCGQFTGYGTDTADRVESAA